MHKHSFYLSLLLTGVSLLGQFGGFSHSGDFGSGDFNLFRGLVPFEWSGLSSDDSSCAMAAQIPDNYLTAVTPGGNVIRFSSQSMPVKVYISNGFNVPGWHRDMRQAVVSAMRTWQTASQGRISFAAVSSADEADIIIRWHKNFRDGILGLSPLEIMGNTVVRSDMDLAVDYPNSDQPIAMEDLTGIAIHEMGHAIGLRGHSSNPNDLMYYSKNRDQNALSQRDINTIRLLYGQSATIQNNVGMSTSQTRLYYAWYQAGVKAQTEKRTPEAIIDYRQAIQLNNNMPEAKFNLGAILINTGNQLAKQGDWTNAMQAFAEASRLYNEIVQLPQAPRGTRENLAIAQNNWSLINSAMSRRGN